MGRKKSTIMYKCSKAKICKIKDCPMKELHELKTALPCEPGSSMHDPVDEAYVSKRSGVWRKVYTKTGKYVDGHHPTPLPQEDGTVPTEEKRVMRCSAWQECQNECELKIPHPERLGDSIKCNIAEGVHGATSVEYIPGDVPEKKVLPVAKIKLKKIKQVDAPEVEVEMRCIKWKECGQEECDHYGAHAKCSECSNICFTREGAHCEAVKSVAPDAPEADVPEQEEPDQDAPEQKPEIDEDEMVICAGWHHCELPKCPASNNPVGVEHKHPHKRTSNCGIPCRSQLGVEGSTCIPFTADIQERYEAYLQELAEEARDATPIDVSDSAAATCIHAVCGHVLPHIPPTDVLSTEQLPDGTLVVQDNKVTVLEAEVKRLKETVLVMNQNQQAILNRERDIRRAMRVAIHYCGEHPGMNGTDLFTDIVNSFSPMEEVAVAWVKAYTAHEAMLAEFKDDGE